MEKQIKFPFTAAGVAQWQVALAGSSPIQRYEEANFVEQGLYTFMPLRFALQPEQVAFLDNLPPALCHLWATQIAYAIREQIPITLIKPGNTGDRQMLGLKFIESGGRTGSTALPQLSEPASLLDADTDYFLRFTVGYEALV